MLRVKDILNAICRFFLSPGAPVFLSTLLILLAGVMIYVFVRLSKEKRHRVVLESYLAQLERAAGELRKVRHRYNNMFQSIVCLIENEEWDAIRNYKDEILKKTSELNKNNLLQLIKIKNYRIRNSILRIVETCNKNNINLTIAVSGEITSVNMDESALCKVIGIFFDYIFDKAKTSSKEELLIEFSSDNQGVSLIFESTFDAVPENEKTFTGKYAGWNTVPAAAKKILLRNKNVMFNNYIDCDHFKQEIMICKRF